MNRSMLGNYQCACGARFLMLDNLLLHKQQEQVDVYRTRLAALSEAVRVSLTMEDGDFMLEQALDKYGIHE